MATTTKTKMIEIDCPRCTGQGNLPHFSHVAGGVCFRCKGAKVVKARVTDTPPPAVTPYQMKFVNYILTGDMSLLNYNQLNTLRDFAHYPVPGFPNLLQIWRERGDSFFFAAQEERLAEFYASRN